MKYITIYRQKRERKEQTKVMFPIRNKQTTKQQLEDLLNLHNKTGMQNGNAQAHEVRGYQSKPNCNLQFMNLTMTDQSTVFKFQVYYNKVFTINPADLQVA